MFTFLASLLFLAAGEGLPPPPPPVPDAEVVRFLKPAEVVEWNNAQRLTQQGELRAKQGNSIMSTSVTAAAASKGPKIGGLTEPPEQIKARAQKIIDEGNAQMQQAAPSLARMRLVAATRAAESFKRIAFPVELALKGWSASSAQSAKRLEAQARGHGFRQVHVVGAVSVSSERKISRPPAFAEEIRSNLQGVGENVLAPVPPAGYRYTLASTKEPAAFSPEVPTPASAGQIALVWGEFYSIAADDTYGLMFVRMADAFSMKVIASEAAFVTTSAAPVAAACNFTLNDARSFLPRLGQSGEWILGYDAQSDPLGAAMLTHICVTQTNVGIGAASYLIAAMGSGAAGNEAFKAHWSVESTSGPSGISFQVRSTPAVAAPAVAAAVEVGRLTLELKAPAAAK